ncbi:TetR/AcrR family transcriptional regulator [Propionimicrobium sp. PCR01-08-3]|uniref:TetR/AcrR family transcriptional regulator n=1 Tax=Propionimicrobium sp. PCR01-08-3 TaxID=3052086 RepID=UPI00255CC6F1|nr:TetR/AcrR family transcriptional regulator [Propionimicrobium sp. PCR01-08-3]WIY83146.1 TetR/AcrR family transcriptional regulator [Propionimicrobium sp. PCR01-08-3]
MARTIDPEKVAKKKAEIAEVAARLFASQGFESTSVAQVAKEVGTSPASIFYYFPDKASLFRAPFEADLPVAEKLIEQHRNTTDPLSSILDVVTVLAADAAYPYAQGMLVESLRRMGHDPHLIAVSEKVASTQRQGLAELIARAIEAGQVDPTLDPDQSAGWLMAIVDACYLNTQPGHDPSAQVRRTALGYLKPGN